MTKHVRVLLATAGVPAMVIALSALLASMWSSRLPAVVAVHWTNGVPNNSAAFDAFLKITLLVSGGLAMAVSALAVTALRRGNGLARYGVGLFVGFVLLPVGSLFGVLVGNLDVRDWREATGSGAVVAATLLVAVVGGLLAAWVAGPSLAARPLSGPADDAPAVGLEPGQRAVWVGSATNRFLMSSILVVPLVGFVVNRVLMIDVPVWMYAALFGVGLVVTLIGSRLGASVDSAGVTIRLGLLGWPRRHLPLDRIDHAETVELGLFKGGGFGYRVNPFTGETFYKLRGGPALAIAMRTGGRVYVAVDHPEAAAGLLNDLLRHRRLATDPPRER